MSRPPQFERERLVPDYLPRESVQYSHAGQPFAYDFKEALELPSPPSSASVSTASAAATASNRHLEASTNWSQHSASVAIQRGITVSSNPRFNMASTHKAQAQCLQLCSAVAAQCDRVAAKMSEYTTMVKHYAYGFTVVANEVLDTCQVLFYIEAGLTEAAHNAQSLPIDMVTALEKKFRNANTDIRTVDLAVTRLLEHEHRQATSRMRRGWGRMFGDSGNLEKYKGVLNKTREDLKISALMFQWKMGGETMESELGIGYIGLAGVLDGSNAALKRVNSMTSEDKNGVYRSPSGLHHHRSVDNHHDMVTSYSKPPTLPPLPKSHKVGSFTSESVNGDANGLLSTELSPTTRYTVSSASSIHGASTAKRTTAATSIDRLGDVHETSKALDNLVSDIKALDLESSKVLHMDSDPFNMPRRKARSAVDAGRPNANQMLVSAVRAGDHKLVMQLLDRGVLADTGSEYHALNEAVATRDAECLRLLLSYGADPNTIDNNGVSPLAIATEKSYMDGMIALLKYGADPNMSLGPDQDTPLTIAATAHNVPFTHVLLMYGGHANQNSVGGNTLLIGSINKTGPRTLIDLLLNYGAGPNEKNAEGKTALFEAITAGRADIVTSLLENGANANLPGPKHMLWPSTYQPACLKVLLLHGADYKKAPGVMELATSINSMESIRILLKAGVDPNAKKDGVYTPLCTSIRDNRADIFELLLKSGADPNVPASEYPAFKCITHHREHFLPALVAAGANLLSPKGIIETAVTSKNAPALKWLLDQGLDPNEKNPKGHTPLTSAILGNHIGFVDVLLDKGANPNVRGQDWPVCMAVKHPEILKRILTVLREPRAFKGVMEMAVVANKLESVKLLLAAGVSVEDRNGGVFSPLTTAIREYRTDIVKFLINEGKADLNAPGEHLPIVKALRRCHTEHTDIIDMLLDKGADPNKVYRGWNGIMQALENGDAAMLKKLCEKCGVNLAVKDELDRTVTEIAISRRWEEAVNILLANAA